jgi:pyruvate dehydrogenase kinase 2/3/4
MRRLHARRLCSGALAEVTARVLREGGEAATTSAIPGPSLGALEALTAAMPPQPVSLLMLKSSVSNRSLPHRLAQANFIKRELIARRAHILTLLHQMPEPLARSPAVGRLGSVYWERLRALLDAPELVSDEDEREFAARQVERNAEIGEIGTAAEEEMCIGALDAMQQERGAGWWMTAPEERLAVDRQLDAIFSTRIGLRFLLQHYVAMGQPPRDGFSGLIETRCSPVALCRQVAESTQAAIGAEYGTAPPIEVVGDVAQTFTYVPSHISIVMGMLLKNSSVATVRQHHQTHGSLERGAAVSAVRCIVAMSEETVQFKLEDAAGGIRRSSLINVWSYRSLNSSWWKPSDGLHLPLARLYCKYFGGDLALVPMEGYGTDCYVTLNRLAHANSENILPLPGAAAEEEGDSAGLFGAQSRIVSRAARDSEWSDDIYERR